VSWPLGAKDSTPGKVTQLVECLIEDQVVVGSSPTLSTDYFYNLPMTAETFGPEITVRDWQADTRERAGRSDNRSDTPNSFKAL
jgi:hypothetical protein